MAYFLGVDIGTSQTKSLLIDEAGRRVAQATSAYALSQPHVGWSEQDPTDWWTATVNTLRKVLADAALPADAIGGIGLSGQMHGAVFLDEDGQPLRPAILWNDQRTAAECATLEREVGREQLIEWTGNVALTGFTAPKILWLRKHEPRLFEDTRMILLPKDYIRYRLTGEYATEVSDASGTLLFDVKNRCWARRLLRKLAIDPKILPRCTESVEVSGQVSGPAAKQTGLAAGTPVVGGGGDQAAGAIGSGIVRPGIVSASLGTSGVIFAQTDGPVCDPEARVHTFCHAVPGQWHIMGVMLSAGGSFQWYRDLFGAEEKTIAEAKGVDVYEILCDIAAEAPAGSRGLTFLPYLTGERCPHPDPLARGAWIGLARAHGKPELIRSLLEGVTFGMRDCLELVRGLGVPIDQIRISGGGARSPFWRQMQADLYGQSVSQINVDEGPAFGVALLAAVAAGAYNSIEEACEATIAIADTTPTQPFINDLYEQLYRQYQTLYPTLAPHFRQIAAIGE